MESCSLQTASKRSHSYTSVDGERRFATLSRYSATVVAIGRPNDKVRVQYPSTAETEKKSPLRASPPLTQFLFQWSNWTISSPKMSKNLKKRTSPVGTDEQILRRCGAISVLRRNFWAISGRNCAAEQILRRVCSLSFRPIRPEITNRIISRAKFEHNVTELRSVRRIWSVSTSTSTVCISHIRHTASSHLVDGQWKIQQGLDTWSPIY